MPKYFAGKARSLKLNSKGIPRNLLIWWLCKKGPLFYPVCLPVASSLCRVLAIHFLECTARAMCWAGLRNPCIQEPPFAFFFFCFVHSLTSHLRPEGSNCATAFKKTKYFKMLCQFPASPHPKNKMFCLVILCMHYFSRLVHKQMIVAFSCVSTASSTHSIEWADCSTLSIHSWSPTAACSQSKDVHVSSTSDTFKSQAFIFHKFKLFFVT